MKIYLKGYYGYQNFGDELLLFGVIEEIFSRYQVDKLVVEVGNIKRIKKRIKKNQTFLINYYKNRNIEIDRRKIHFFSPEEYFAERNFLGIHLPNKRNIYLNIFLGNHPFHNYFKVFGGGEVIDESRSFPHNGWNILLLYMQSIFHGKFTLRGGLGSQKNFFTRRLTRFLIQSAKSLLLRERHSFKICQHVLGKNQKKAELFHDFSKNIIKFWIKNYKKTEKHEQTLINISPSFDKKKRENLAKKLNPMTEIIIFPCDLNFDLLNINTYLNQQNYKIFNWTESDLPTIFTLLSQANLGIGSRLHFLYCLKELSTKYVIMSTSSKLNYNL